MVFPERYKYAQGAILNVQYSYKELYVQYMYSMQYFDMTNRSAIYCLRTSKLSLSKLRVLSSPLLLEAAGPEGSNSTVRVHQNRNPVCSLAQISESDRSSITALLPDLLANVNVQKPYTAQLAHLEYLPSSPAGGTYHLFVANVHLSRNEPERHVLGLVHIGMFAILRI